jgi:hypothetical protein
MENKDTTYDNRTIEQKFAQITFEKQVNQMSHKQAQQFLIYMHKMNTIKENSYQAMLKQSWFKDFVHD